VVVEQDEALGAEGVHDPPDHRRLARPRAPGNTNDDRNHVILDLGLRILDRGGYSGRSGERMRRRSPPAFSIQNPKSAIQNSPYSGLTKATVAVRVASSTSVASASKR